MIRTRAFALMLCAAAFGALSSSAQTPLIPIDTLFGVHYVRAAQLSPDGTKVAFLAPNGGTYGIAVLDLATRKVTIPVHIEGDNVQSFYWKGNDRMVFEGDIAGFESPQVAVTDVDGKRVFSVIRPQTRKLRYSAYSGEVISRRVDDPLHIMILGFTTDSNQSSEDQATFENPSALLMSVDLRNGERSLVCPASEGDVSTSLSDFSVDHAGEVRTALRAHGDRTDLVYRDHTSEPWRLLRSFPAQGVSWEVIGFTHDNSLLYIRDFEASQTGALRTLDPSNLQLGPVIFAPEGGEIGQDYPPAPGIILSPKDGRLIGVSYTTDKLHYHWIDAGFKTLFARLEQTFPGYTVALSSIADDEKRVLIRTLTASDPGAYYLLDLNKGSLGLVTAAAPLLLHTKLAPVTPISFKARDGLTIPGYLTLPAEYKPGHPVPLVLHPHGGPFGPRDNWVFDPEVQFLANRGYAVLQVNFRGSGGYGIDFQQAGYREWGGTMQNDLTDGVKWAIAQGYADPSRVAIFGASYGGYATLAGLVFTPELYRCGINYVGVSDLVELTRRKDAGENAGMLSFYRGTIGATRQQMFDRSPVNFIDRLRVPLLNAYGENDPRVDIAQWVELKAQLDKYHKDYDYILAKDEGHGYSHPEDAVAFYSKVEAFLARNLKGSGAD